MSAEDLPEIPILIDDTPNPRSEMLSAQMDLLYLASQVRILRTLQNQVEREGATASSDIAKAAQGSGRIIDELLDAILGPRDYVPTFESVRTTERE